MNNQNGTNGQAGQPRRKLSVARETLRGLGAAAMRQAAGGTGYEEGPYSEDTMCTFSDCTVCCTTDCTRFCTITDCTYCCETYSCKC